MSCDGRAQKVAEYLQRVLWAVGPANLIQDEPLFHVLTIDTGPITIKAERNAIEIHRGKTAAGPNGRPLENWKAIADDPTTLLGEGASQA